jgi:hypothetical protein
MNRITDNPSFDPYANLIAENSGEATNRDPFGHDRDVANTTERARRSEALRASAGTKLSFAALESLAPQPPVRKPRHRLE